MGFAIVLIVIVAAATMISMAFLNQAKAAKAELAKVVSARQALEDKMSQMRKELSAIKEDAAKKNKLLDEARDVARKKLRKEAIKVAGELETEALESNSEVERLKKALNAMEAQIRSFQTEADRAVAQAKQDAKAEFERQLGQHKEEMHKLQDQLGLRKDNAARQKRAVEQTLAPIDVSSLSDDLVAEIARLMRKAEHNEKLQGVAQAKLQMAGERFAEMQKRYFAVCRELALAAGQSPQVSDQEARDTAETILAASDALHVEHADPSAEHGEEPAHTNGVVG